eukprot:m.157782 g.157782  ORF g.157782 m.157782 type:complete len:415 (-) comp31066_c0_seq1:461-1705(-)
MEHRHTHILCDGPLCSDKDTIITGFRFQRYPDDFDLCQADFNNLSLDEKFRYQVIISPGASPVIWYPSITLLPGLTPTAKRPTHGTPAPATLRLFLRRLASCEPDLATRIRNLTKWRVHVSFDRNDTFKKHVLIDVDCFINIKTLEFEIRARKKKLLLAMVGEQNNQIEIGMHATELNRRLTNLIFCPNPRIIVPNVCIKHRDGVAPTTYRQARTSFAPPHALLANYVPALLDESDGVIKGFLFVEPYKPRLEYAPQMMMRMFQPENGRDGFDAIQVPEYLTNGHMTLPTDLKMSELIEKECELRLSHDVLTAFADPVVDDGRLIETIQLKAGAEVGLGIEALDLIRCASVLFPHLDAVKKAHYVKYNRATQGQLRQGDTLPTCVLHKTCGATVSLKSFMKPGRPLIVAAGSYT